MYLQHDAFARTELKRETVTTPNQTCLWCGQERKRLYRYGTESDGGRFYGFVKGPFCALDCFKAYHN